MSNSRSGTSQLNGNSNRRHPTLNRNNSNEKSSNSSQNTEPDPITAYISNSWNNVYRDLERNTGTTQYYKQESHNLKDFRPFNLEAFWGRRTVQYYQQNQTRHS